MAFWLAVLTRPDSRLHGPPEDVSDGLQPGNVSSLVVALDLAKRQMRASTVEDSCVLTLASTVPMIGTEALVKD